MNFLAIPISSGRDLKLSSSEYLVKGRHKGVAKIKAVLT